MGVKRISVLTAIAGCALAVALVASGSVGKPTVSTAQNAALGKIVVGATGRTLYHYLDDHGSKIDCKGGCAAQWPPVLIARSAKPVAGSGIKASKLGTIVRPDGTVQVTYNGYPLYRFSGDTKNGQVNGQGLEKSWYVVAPTGAIIRASASAASVGAASSSSTSGGSSSSGGSSDDGSGSGGYGY